MTLSILIPTLPERYALLKRLQDKLLPQVQFYSDRIAIYYNDAGRAMSIGEKRNSLLSQVITDYSVFIDDDDLVSGHYINRIIHAIDQKPDVVTFNGYMTTNGGRRQNFVIKLGERYEQRNNTYYRFPNHLCPMRTELIRQVKFPHIVSGEDYAWARTIHDRKLLKTSIHIEEDLYHYDFNSYKTPYGGRTKIRQ